MKNIRVLVVDDSAFSRRTISMMLDGMEGVEVVGYAVNGEEGIQKTVSLKPDLVTLDLEMPKMDGFTLLRILNARFSMPVIVVSALSSADKVFKALELGAVDFVAKPSTMATPELLGIREDLLRKVRQAVNARIHRVASDASRASVVTPQRETVLQKSPFRFQRVMEKPTDGELSVVAIGASTGGPPALQNILSSIDRDYPFCFVISQHMPAGFTRAFAERLDRSSRFSVKEAVDGDILENGLALIAPGGQNMIFERCGEKYIARITEPTQDDRYIPSVDVMFNSCAHHFRERATAVILTGMGNDGSKGIRRIKECGGYVIAESEESAVVYGMPREAVATGLVDRISPLDRISREIISKWDISTPLPQIRRESNGAL